MDPRNNPYHGASYDRYSQRTEHSTSHKLKNAYWTTKQAVIQKFGRKEDEHVVASDLELDSKLELFKSVQKTCSDLIRVIERYQEKICALSQAENEMGRFLKNRSSQDKTQAGKIMAAVGKSLSFSAQQRLVLRVPLTRLQQEVETFRYRAVSDTLITIQRMEASRTEYRGALLWMKDASEELDPDTFKQLEKFRKVQAQVRKTKSFFDKNKLDSMQKIDLLAASRCNMFSHVLSTYQDTLLQFWEKTSRTMMTVAESFRGYQYYEFSMLKDLAPESRKLAEITSKNESDSCLSSKQCTDLQQYGLTGMDQLVLYDPDSKDTARSSLDNQIDDLDRKLDEIFSSEYKEEPEEDIKAALASAKNHEQRMSEANNSNSGQGDDAPMLSLEMDDDDDGRRFLEDLLSGAPGNTSKEASILGMEENSFAQQWDKVFGNSNGFTAAASQPLTSSSGNNMSSNQSTPSALLSLPYNAQTCGSNQQDIYSAFDDLLIDESPLQIDWFGSMRSTSTTGGFSTTDPFLDMTRPGPSNVLSQSSLSNKGANSKPSSDQFSLEGLSKKMGDTSQSISTSKAQNDMNRWVNLFADLDPLANPDQLSKKEGQITDA